MTLWTYPGVNTFRKGRMDDLQAHPTVKSWALVADAIKGNVRITEALAGGPCRGGLGFRCPDSTANVSR